MAAMDDAAAAALGKPIELLQKELDRRKRTDGVDEATAAMGELDLSAAALGNSTELLQQDGAPEQELLRIAALNANSIAGKKKQRKLKKAIPESGFHIFIVIETKLTKGDSVPTLAGFRDERKDRLYAKKKGHSKSKTTGVETTLNTSPGGGILIYIHDTVVYKVKSKGEYAESNVEFLHIEITTPVRLHLVALYSPNKVLVDHLISLMSYFMDPLGDRKKIMFIGDTNIDKKGSGPGDCLGNTFFDVLSRKPYKVKQLIKQITHDKACIDHIFTNMKVLESDVMPNCITPHGDHNGIYCTIAYSTTDVDTDQVQAALQVPGFQGTDADSSNANLIQPLMNEISNNCISCILAIVCKFKLEVSPSKITYNGEHLNVHSHCHKSEGMCYISVDAVKGMEQRIEQLQKAIGEVHEHFKEDVKKTEKQCIIFTRNSQTKVFHDLQKKMWYRDWGWDVVWQLRHVEFLDYVLEPSLTHAFKMSGGDCLWNKLPDEPEEKSIELEESSYRYWSEGGRSISRLTV